jgi:hypothetical protein
VREEGQSKIEKDEEELEERSGKKTTTDLSLKSPHSLWWRLPLLRHSKQDHPLPHLRPLDPLEGESNGLTGLSIVDIYALPLNALDVDGEEGMEGVGTEESDVAGADGLRWRKRSGRGRRGGGKKERTNARHDDTGQHSPDVGNRVRLVHRKLEGSVDRVLSRVRRADDVEKSLEERETFTGDVADSEDGTRLLGGEGLGERAGHAVIFDENGLLPATRRFENLNELLDRLLVHRSGSHVDL